MNRLMAHSKIKFEKLMNKFNDVCIQERDINDHIAIQNKLIQYLNKIKPQDSKKIKQRKNKQEK